MKKFVVIGGLWFDKVNGNTYHKAKILDVEKDEIFYSDFEYGYGSQYMATAEETIKEKYKDIDFKCLNFGYMYDTKRNIKNGWF